MLPAARTQRGPQNKVVRILGWAVMSGITPEPVRSGVIPQPKTNPLHAPVSIYQISIIAIQLLESY